MNHPLLDQINALAAEWHACLLQAADGRWRRATLLSRAAMLEERLDLTWARYRRSLAVQGKDRFKDIGQRIYYTTPQHK
jgi:hypothetical protein